MKGNKYTHIYTNTHTHTQTHTHTHTHTHAHSQFLIILYKLITTNLVLYKSIYNKRLVDVKIFPLNLPNWCHVFDWSSKLYCKM